ncbi:MAG: pyridoxamine 5'-phosphate oxidase family protein [Paeniglutamicibacter sp.]
MANEEVEKVLEIIKDVRIGMFTTHGRDALLSRPLTVTEVDGNGDLWFFSTVSSEIVGEVKANHSVNVSFAGAKKWVSVSGRATVVQEVEKKRELWNSMVETFAPDGVDSPNTVLLHVESDSAEYWENPGGAASVVASWVKQKVTGKGSVPGDSATVEL